MGWFKTGKKAREIIERRAEEAEHRKKLYEERCRRRSGSPNDDWDEFDEYGEHDPLDLYDEIMHGKI